MVEIFFKNLVKLFHSQNLNWNRQDHVTFAVALLK